MSDTAATAVSWLVTWMLHSTLLYAAAWCVDRLALLRAPAAREHLWRAAMFGALLTAGLQVCGLAGEPSLRAHPAFTDSPAAASGLSAGGSTPGATAGVAPAEPVALPGPVAPSAPGVVATIGADPATAGAGAAASAADPSARAAAAAPGASARGAAAAPAWRAALAGFRAALSHHWAGVLLAVWLTGAAVAALRLVGLGLCARRELAGRVPARGALAAEWAALCITQRVSPPPLSIAPALTGPVSLPNGEVALSPWAGTLLPRRRRALLAHELAHQVRRDPQWQLLALSLHALLWVQPLHALARARLAALAELQADAWAARAVGDPRALAECLAECAERLTDHRAALFGAAMTRGSLLVERVDRLLEEPAMRDVKTSWRVRGAVAAALATATLLFPGCDLESVHVGGGSSTSIHVSHDGREAAVKVRRSGYALDMECDGKVAFAADESDVAELEPGARFTLVEKLDGVEHEYKVLANAGGALTRSLRRDGADVALDEEGRQWLAAALPRMFRESGFDSEARVERLLARGGVEAVLAEADLAGTDHGRASYLAAALANGALDAEQAGKAIAAAGKLTSDHELRRTLTAALKAPALDGPRLVQLLRAADSLQSDHERAELLIDAARRLPADAEGRAAWLAAARGIGSDHDLGRTLREALDRCRDDASFTAELIQCASQELASDHDLGQVLKPVARRGSDPAIAAAYLAAARQLGSDFERRSALTELIEEARLEPAVLAGVLDVAATLDSSFEKGEVLKELADRVAQDESLTLRYREVASGMNDHERGAALLALDKAARAAR